jgi:hypothetical protein
MRKVFDAQQRFHGARRRFVEVIFSIGETMATRIGGVVTRAAPYGLRRF